MMIDALPNRHHRFQPGLATALIAGFLFLPASIAPAWGSGEISRDMDPRWEESIAAYVAADREKAPAPGGVVFVGSSSIRLWRELETQLSSTRRVINRGFGGARLADCTRYLDRLVFPHAPRLIVVYAGDNDLAEGRPPKEVFNDFVRFVETVRKTLPETKIAYVSIKPSPARAALIAQAQETNYLIRQFAAGGANLDFVDVFTPMLDERGRPRTDLFQADRLHLNSAGYELWASIIGPRVR
jgi:lysophospholipase L1-like esterase